MKRTVHGTIITESQVDQWVDEAEAGYDVSALKKRAIGRPGRSEEPSQVVPVRLTAEELEALMQRAEREHLNRSAAIRAALSEWSRVA